MYVLCDVSLRFSFPVCVSTGGRAEVRIWVVCCVSHLLRRKTHEFQISETILSEKKKKKSENGGWDRLGRSRRHISQLWEDLVAIFPNSGKMSIYFPIPIVRRRVATQYDVCNLSVVSRQIMFFLKSVRVRAGMCDILFLFHDTSSRAQIVQTLHDLCSNQVVLSRQTDDL